MKSDNFSVVVNVFGATVAMIPLIAIIVWLSGGFVQHSKPIYIARAWEETKDSTSIADFELFKQRYCTTAPFYCQLAENKIKLIMSQNR
jgi:hypothetical protein